MKKDEKITLWSERIHEFQFSGQTCKTMVSGTSRSSLYNELLDAQAEKIGRTIRYRYDFCKNANGKRDFKE